MNKMPKICVYTLGCKVNLYDSDAMLNIFNNFGFEVIDYLDFADIYIVNTCAVTSEAEKKSRQIVSKIIKINKNSDIYICGCASQNKPNQFYQNNVKIIYGTDNKIRLANSIVEKYLNNKPIPVSDYSISDIFEENSGILNLKTRHFTKIEDGCNNFCSYCLIPYVRGRVRSRSLDNIINEIETVKNNVKEIVITGINLSAYGTDIGTNLTELMLLLSKYNLRIRLGSLEVNVINKEFLDSTKLNKYFCPHFHLSLQSGDNDVLKNMNRHYTVDKYYDSVKLIREYYPNAAITTDIIVGFPGETDIQFNNTYNFAKQIEFSDIHVFPYSSREGTVAAKLNQVHSNKIYERTNKLLELKKELILKYLNKQLNRKIDVLLESYENGYWCGHSSNYVKVYSKTGSRNEIINIIPHEIYNDGIK